MSTDASAGAADDAGDGNDRSDYAEMIDDLDAAISEARKKVESGRVYDAENERVRQGWIRVLAYATNVRRQVTTDRDLEELAERIDELEDAQEGDR
ncbi:hypothetical protein [Haloferax sp. Q22]|uniref:hypothetical protein n=1 Tax=Haloferax sp. (strain Q22) TaxID=1526048 RepID=UPI000737AFE3|nr:hypothetical protein [Haloferax sp. Q22]